MKRCLLKEQKVQIQTKTQPFQIVTTTHKDVTDRLSQINPTLAFEARKVLDVNKSERHIRGGLATKEKYLHKQAQ
ncbi:MAG: sporulation transcriptional regulator SpoIIID [Parabacteroides sp.]|nr:sporulation transcriptional regulator SpoIIID [Parabacteroides sp.]